MSSMGGRLATSEARHRGQTSEAARHAFDALNSSGLFNKSFAAVTKTKHVALTGNPDVTCALFRSCMQSRRIPEMSKSTSHRCAENSGG